MAYTREQLRSGYYVSGVVGYGTLRASLDDALDAADAINQTAGVDEGGRGKVFVVPAMFIVYEQAEEPGDAPA